MTVHLHDFRAESVERYGHTDPLIGLALCGARDVRATTHHEIARGRVSCGGCLQEYGMREDAKARARASAAWDAWRAAGARGAHPGAVARLRAEADRLRREVGS